MNSGLLQTAFETIAPGYYKGKYGDLVIVMNKEGYVNCTVLAKLYNKEISNWMKNDSAKNLVSELKRSLLIRSDPIIKITFGQNENRGTYMHPLLVPMFAAWLDAKFAIQISKIINDFYIKEASIENDKKLREKDVVIGEKQCRISELERKLDEGFSAIHAANKDLITRNDELLAEIRQANESNEVLLCDVETLNTTVDKIANKLDIATDDRVVRPVCNKDMQLFAIFSNKLRTEYRTIRRQVRTFNIAKRNLAASGFDVEILKLEPSPNPINLQIRIKEKLGTAPGILKLNCNSIVIDGKKMTEANLLAMIRVIDTEKKILNE